MDSLTQIVLGAAVGEATLGKKVGNKALLWGAVAGTIPDLDVLTKHFVDQITANELHRGVSHSLLFCLFFAPIFAWLVRKQARAFLSVFLALALSAPFFGSTAVFLQVGIAFFFIAMIYLTWTKQPGDREASQWDWTKLFFWTLVTHPLLDAHTTWGTQFFWPFEYKVAYKNIFVVDPLYTVPFLIFTIMVLFQRRGSAKRRRYNNLGLAISSAYMVLTIAFKGIAFYKIDESLDHQHIAYTEMDTRPTIFNSILWGATVESDSAYYMGYYSLLDKDNDIPFGRFPKNYHLLGKMADEELVHRLIKLSQGWYTVEEADGNIFFNDLRFGQISMDEQEKRFVFSYELKYVDGQLQAIEVPKNFDNAARWIKELGKRIGGK